jgi:hypothetical protein
MATLSFTIELIIDRYKKSKPEKGVRLFCKYVRKMFFGTPKRFLGAPKRFLGAPKMFLGSPKMFLGAPKMFLGAPKRFLVAPKRFLGRSTFRQGTRFFSPS